MASALTLGQGAAGAVMAGSPAAAARWSAAGPPAPPSWIVRILGGRMAAQAVAVNWVRRRRPADEARALRIGAVVDGLHGASMILAAVVFPRYRRSALVSAGMALTAAGVGGAAAR